MVPEDAMAAALAEDPSRPGYLESGFRLVLAVNKADLLPSAVTHTRLEVCPRPCNCARICVLDIEVPLAGSILGLEYCIDVLPMYLTV